MSKALLMILDGWGHAPASDDNSVFVGHTPNWDRLLKNYPNTLIKTSGESVGLPKGQMGNSEVGHMNIGAGRVVYQSLTKIQKAVDEHGLHQNQALCKACEISADNALHVLGLISSGGVHSHEAHIEAIIKLAKSKGVKHIYLHAFLDGRDVAPQSAKASIEKFMQMEDEQFAIASVTGRYYAMDRDNNWDRVQTAYNVITTGKSQYKAVTALDALEQAYARGETDEFVKATVLTKAQNVKSGDAIVCANFRADRARQLIEVFYDQSFSHFETQNIELAQLVTMTQYSEAFDVDVAFPPEQLSNGLGETVSKKGLKQLRIAETEKYAHVTYFFNGGDEQVFDGEDRILVKSPNVATYDLKPEMSAEEVTEKLVEAIKKDIYDFICINFANPDMVGHSGDLNAAVKAVEFIDQCMGQVVTACESIGMSMLITADHGNCEQMQDKETGKPMTAHTTNPVDLVLVDKNKNLTLDDGGALCDLAPSVLDLMELEQPSEMTGRSLII